jgi:hypothetical protein
VKAARKKVLDEILERVDEFIRWEVKQDIGGRAFKRRVLEALSKDLKEKHEKDQR